MKAKRNSTGGVALLISRSGAFSLLEVLAVVAISALVISMLFTGLRSLTAKARSAQCLSDLKQTGVALSLFAADNNGFLPEVYVPTSPWTWPYILQRGGYFPPKWGSSPLEVPSCRVNPRYRATYTYGINDFLTERAYKIFEAKKPSQTMLVADSLCEAGPSNAYRVGDSDAYGKLAFLHAGSVNVLYWDGHAAGIKEIPAAPSRLENVFWNPLADDAAD